MKSNNIYIVSLVWSLPVVMSIFLIISFISFPQIFQLLPLFKSLFLCFGFACSTNFFYKKFNNLGLAILSSISIIISLGIIPLVGPILYWGLICYIIFKSFPVFIKSLEKKEMNLIIKTSLVLFCVMLPYFSLEYSQPNNEARLLNSQLHTDTLYHTSIASMFKIYHSISHGLHGLGKLEYHFGSHIFLSQSSNLVLMPAFQAYNYLFVFLCLPLLGISVIGVSEEILPSKSLKNFYCKLGIYFFFFLGTGILSSGSLLSRFAVWNSFFVSESYELSLILLMSLFSILLLKKISSAILIILILLLFSMIVLTKISTGFIALSCLGSWALLSGEKYLSNAWKERWVIFVLACVIFFFLSQLINPGRSDAHIEPFQFINAYVKFNGPSWLKITLFVFFQFLLPILALLYLALNYLTKKVLVLPRWWILGLIFSSLFGSWVLFMLYVNGGSGWYFSNLSMFIALPFLLCIIQIEGINVSKIPKIFMLLPVLVFLIYAPNALRLGTKHFLSDVRQSKPNTNLTAYIEKMNFIRNDIKTTNSLVYIPRTEIQYWKSMDCRSIGFVIPAISQRPALYGWPSNDCYDFLCGTRFHSNGLCEKSQKNYSDSELLNEAKNLGFSAVEVITSKSIRSLR
ncbi:hypothetical protein [Candidatus Methylopumilus planktonicus]|uniref:hypothetical protein n=1 Tax=Candidatus Methylopumilus planktonicus TaxID=1581557 RepID=UPI003D18C12D